MGNVSCESEAAFSQTRLFFDETVVWATKTKVLIPPHEYRSDASTDICIGVIDIWIDVPAP